ncbi:aspartate-semialdehyde dehydrogenase [Cryomorpha ignava]|uniref:Aspartate-semialdehyde dehydrogenase n=1 Tax=Cryomorpha ignava TaxID=101383 RepID=A0A7K3WK91_9FLAO|nr:aspartate-semialdehyde dehydrogenase [Cryomorpha ignava]NEN22056.1 aspartate-semialdehyde dehydrogenase [Cryomorpha ignava]
MRVAVIGATGMVGNIMLKVLKERKFPADEIIAVASERSAGLEKEINGKVYKIMGMAEAIAQKPDIALFSAGGATSLEFAPQFAAVGTTVIDNSSAWRMSPDHKLIVPEINGNTLTKDDKIIANPNCSTIQLVVTLAPLHRKYGIKRVVVSTYQSVSGTGVNAVRQMLAERRGEQAEMVYPYPIDLNCIPHCDVFEENGYTKEEMKLTNETKKILDRAIDVTATAVRVPVVGGHSESVNISFENDFDLGELRKLLHDTPGIVLQDNPDVNSYPMPRYAHERDEVFVGRIRRDFSQPKSVNLWIVADNLRKGAATNAVQIAEIVAGLK